MVSVHHTGYKPDTVAVICAGNGIDSALHKGLQRVGFRVQLLAVDQLDQLRSGALVINAASCGGISRQQVARQACRALPQTACSGLLHLSSYRVFAGGARKRYDEDDEALPDSNGGQAWFECEQLLAGMDNLSVLRLGWQVDRNEHALLGRIVSGLLARKPVELDHLSRGNPVTLADLTRVVVAMMQQLASGAPKRGIYHYGAADDCSALEFGREVVDRVQALYGDDFPAELVELSGGADEVSAMLACGKLRDVFGIQQRSWRQGLTRQVELWLERLQAVS